MLQAVDKYLTLNIGKENYRLAYRTIGAGPVAVLYLHGVGCSKDDFHPELFVATEQYTVITFDFPGCGDSSYEVTAYLGMDDLVELVHTLVQKLQLHDIALVGHSMGGLIGLLLVEKYPHLFRCFVDVEGNLSEKDTFFSSKVANMKYEKFLQETWMPLIAELQKETNKGKRAFGHTLMQASPQAFYDYCPSMVHYAKQDLVEKLCTLEVPACYVYGEESAGYYPLDDLEDGEIELLEIPESDHFPCYDNPKVYYETIFDWIKSQQ